MSDYFRTFTYTALALFAFAANSVFCRMALAGQSIDWAGFTVIRLLSGSVTLVLLVILSQRNTRNILNHGSWLGSAMLFVYALFFSLAYLELNTGTGALILFGSVQVAMLLITFYQGVQVSRLEWLGFAVSILGFTYLMLPDATAPSLIGFILMAIAGLAWAIYTLQGRASSQPLADTQGNFVKTIPLVTIVVLLFWTDISLTSEGATYAILSGSLASGIGYAIWYKALGGLSALQAGSFQLLVPVIATVGGITLLSEPLTTEFILASSVLLGGIFIMIKAKQRN